MGVYCRREDDFDEVMPYELSYDGLAVVTVADKPEHVEATKSWTEYT